MNISCGFEWLKSWFNNICFIIQKIIDYVYFQIYIEKNNFIVAFVVFQYGGLGDNTTDSDIGIDTMSTLYISNPEPPPSPSLLPR